MISGWWRSRCGAAIKGPFAGRHANSPDLAKEMLNAIMDALAAHGTMSKQALDSAKLRGEMQDVLLGPGPLDEALRERGASAS